MTDYDDPAVEEQWCNERRREVIAYLESQGIDHGRVAEWPAWHVAPYVSIWAVESRNRPESIGWWVICGDLPTDYVSSHGIAHPREAMRAIADRWNKLVPFLERGEEHPEWTVGTPERRAELAPLLGARGKLLAEWADDDSMWVE